MHKSGTAQPLKTGGPIRLLHQRFVLALILDGQDNTTVRATLDHEDLDTIDDTGLDKLRAELAPPKKFTTTNRKHRSSLEYLDSIGLREFFCRTPECDEAMLVLRTPRAREIVEVALIIHAPVDAAVAHLRQHKVVVTSKAVELFERWFWAVSAFDRVTLRTVLELRATRRALRNVKGDDERRSAYRAARSDARLLAVSLPRSGASWQLALCSLGHAPATVRVDRLLAELQSHSALRVAESVMRGSPGDEARAASFMSILRNAYELHQQLVPADLALRDTLATLHLISDPRPIPTIHELSGGMHTADLQPPPVASDA